MSVADAFPLFGGASNVANLVPKPKQLDPPTREDTDKAAAEERERARRRRGRASTLLSDPQEPDPIVGRSTLLGGA